MWFVKRVKKIRKSKKKRKEVRKSECGVVINVKTERGLSLEGTSRTHGRKT